MSHSADRHAMLDFSRRESWVVHAALLARIERRNDVGDCVRHECDLLYAVETDDDGFGLEELQVFQTAVARYLTGAPSRDRKPARAVIDRIDDALSVRGA